MEPGSGKSCTVKTATFWFLSLSAEVASCQTVDEFCSSDIYGLAHGPKCLCASELPEGLVTNTDF